MFTDPSMTVTAQVIFNVTTVGFSALLTYLGIGSEAFTLFALLLGIDYVTGVLKARAIGQSITSNRMKYGIISKLSLIIVPIVLAIGAKAIGADASSVLSIGINILVLSEVYSIIGNIYSIRTRLELPEYDVVSAIGKRIRAILIKAENDTQS